jgi:biopolymer transport protein ExbD
MAMGVGPQSTSGRRSGRRSASLGSLSEMNIVPLVDIVFVLLIIFMVTAHAMNSAIKIEAPTVRQVNDTAEDLPQVAITRDGKIFLNSEPVTNINLLVSDINKKFGNPKAVYLLADRKVIWDTPVQVMAVLGAAKLGISVVTIPQDLGKKP